MELMTIEQTAKFLQANSRQAVDNLLHTGVLPKDLTVKVGKRRLFIKEKLVEHLLNESKKESA